MSRKIDYPPGTVFTSLTVVGPAKSIRRKAAFLTVCVCGNTKVVIGQLLRIGAVKSCGCLRIELGGTRGRRNLGAPGETAFNGLYYSYRKSASQRGHTFELTKEQLRQITTKNCHYCGVEPRAVKKSRNNNGDYIYNGIDRKDNAGGYILENCLPCCSQCNYSKKDQSYVDFISYVRRLVKFNKEVA